MAVLQLLYAGTDAAEWLFPSRKSHLARFLMPIGESERL